MRLLLVFLGLAALVLLTFFIWGDSLMEIFSQSGTISWLTKSGKWAWLLAILLLMGDLLLPLPATLIMAAIGYIYGPIGGGLISAAGSFLAGSFGYWLCRLLGEKTARRVLGEKDYALGKKLSGNVGGWVVVLSRWLPVFPGSNFLYGRAYPHAGSVFPWGIVVCVGATGVRLRVHWPYRD